MGTSRLRALQTSFLIGEEVIPGYLGHNATAMVFEGPAPDVSELAEQVAVRTRTTPRYRQRVAEVPGGLARPVFVDDEGFAARRHIHAVHAPAPGGDRELRAIVASELARPLARERPLWDLVLIDGLAGGRWALLSKVHEAMAEGASVVPNLHALFGPAGGAAGERRASVAATPARLAAEAVLDGTRAAARAARGLGAAVLAPRRSLAGAARAWRGIGELAEAGRRPVLETPFNGQSGPRRAVQWLTLDRADLQRAARRHAVTTNDVYIAIAAGGLRAWLQGQAIETGAAPFRAMVPVAVHDDARDEETQLGMLAVPLPVDAEEPERRVALTAAAMRDALGSSQGAALATVLTMQDALPVGVLRAAGPKLWTAQGLNITVTSTPGVLGALTACGRRLLGAWEIGFLTPGLKLTFAALVQEERFAMSIIADPDAVDDLDGLARLCADEAAALGVRTVPSPTRGAEIIDGPATPAPAGLAADMLEAQAARTPEAPAVEFGGARISYAELNARANRLAHRLREHGAGPDVPVAVCLERSAELVTALVAVLKAGAPYVPLDPVHPDERLRVMLEDAAPRVIVTQPALRERLATEAPVVPAGDALEGVSEANPARDLAGEHVAYVIYTSGSTGTPKGVEMPHSALANMLAWQSGAFARPGPARTLQFASAGFDVALQDILSTLTTGGCVVMIPDDLRHDFDALAEFIQANDVQRLFVPPLVLNELATRLDPARGRLEVIAAGERLEITPPIRRLFAAADGWTLDNHYGPTESHVATVYRLPERVEDWPQYPPVGRPIANVSIRLEAGGELYVGGAGLARGYRNRPELTAERFADGWYRTGDLARRRADGELEFLGRADDQLKVRGFRVEPGEIETRLRAHEGVRDAAVVAADGALVAYVVPAGGSVPSALRRFLEEALPAHMIPSAFVSLQRLPLTPNGKLDRRALPASPAPDAREHVAPRDGVETRLAAIWEEVLGVDRVGVDDDFFELGGHSLLAATVTSRAREAFGRDLPLALLYQGPTIAQMARAIEPVAARRAARARIVAR